MDEKGILGNFTTDLYPLKCVVCGQVLEVGEEDQCEKMGIPGGCEAHILEVADECELGHSMWPSHWFGHWMLREDDGAR